MSTSLRRPHSTIFSMGPSRPPRKMRGARKLPQRMPPRSRRSRQRSRQRSRRRHVRRRSRRPRTPGPRSWRTCAKKSTAIATRWSSSNATFPPPAARPGSWKGRQNLPPVRQPRSRGSSGKSKSSRPGQHRGAVGEGESRAASSSTCARLSTRKTKRSSLCATRSRRKKRICWRPATSACRSNARRPTAKTSFSNSKSGSTRSRPNGTAWRRKRRSGTSRGRTCAAKSRKRTKRLPNVTMLSRSSRPSPPKT